MVFLIVLLIFAGTIYLTFSMPLVAFIVTPILSIVCAGLALTASIDPDIPAVVLAILMFPAVVIINLARPVDSHEYKDTWQRIWAKEIAKVLMHFINFAVWVFLFHAPGFFIFLIIEIFLIPYYLSYKSDIALNIISTIKGAMQQSLPLPMALESAAHGSIDKRARILRKIAYYLKQGYSLTESMEMGYKACPTNVLASIRAAEKIDRLPDALESIQADFIEKTDERKKISPLNPTYPFVVLVATMLIILGMSIFIMPTFAMVLNDMSDGTMILPRSTRIVMAFSQFLTHNWIGIILGIIASIIVSSLIYFIFSRRRRPLRPSIYTIISDNIKWRLPIIHWLELNFCMLTVTSQLRLSIDAGLTVDKAIESAVELDINYVFRRRLLRWLDALRKGQTISTAARKARLGKALAWAFDTNINGQNTPQLLQMLENTYRVNYNYRANIARSIGWPFFILALGMTVGFVVYAHFIPLVAMLSYMSEAFFVP